MINRLKLLFIFDQFFEITGIILIIFISSPTTPSRPILPSLAIQLCAIIFLAIRPALQRMLQPEKKNEHIQETTGEEGENDSMTVVAQKRTKKTLNTMKVNTMTGIKSYFSKESLNSNIPSIPIKRHKLAGWIRKQNAYFSVFNKHSSPLKINTTLGWEPRQRYYKESILKHVLK